MKQTVQQKREIRRTLRDIAVSVLESEGWTADKLKVPYKKATYILRGHNKPPVRVGIKTSQFAELGFAYQKDGTLNVSSGVSAIVASIWNNEKNPTHAVVSWFPLDAVAQAVAEAKAAREATGEVIKPGDVIWVKVHTHHGTGLGDLYPPLATVPLGPVPLGPSTLDPVAETISDAKLRVATALHVRPEAVQISIVL
jgi:hypothetical protein